MCYSVSQLKLKKYKNAIRAGLDDDTRIRLYQDYLDSYFKEFDINQKDYKYYHVSGFNYDKPLTVIVDEPDFLQEMSWGLIPNWVGSEEKASEIRTKTINARGETMFEKPSFKDAALNKRCLLIVDGFFEYHIKPGRKIYLINNFEEVGLPDPFPTENNPSQSKFKIENLQKELRKKFKEESGFFHSPKKIIQFSELFNSHNQFEVLAVN